MAARKGPVLDFSRTTEGWHWNGAGVLVPAATNEPRFNHDPVTGAPVGLLIEEERENQIIRSEEFNNGVWSKLGTPAPTITADQVTAPDGDTAADQCDFGADEASRFDQSVTARTSAGDTVIVSCWARVSSGTEAFRLGTWGTVSGNQLSSDQTVTTAWQRFSYSTTYDGGDTARISVFRNASDGAARTIYFWGAQLEVASFPTSYIPTTTVAVTRAADVCQTTDLSWYNGALGTFYGRAVIDNDIGGVLRKFLCAVNDGTADNILGLAQTNGDSTAQFNSVHSAGDNAFVSVGAVVSDVPFQLAAAYEADDVAGSLDGGAVGADTTADYPLPGVNIFDVGARIGGNAYLNGHLQAIKYFNVRKPDHVLERMTSAP